MTINKACQNVKYSWWQYLLPPFLLSIITTIFYYPSLIYGFFFDDLPTITKNIGIINGSQFLSFDFFKNNRWISRWLNSQSYRLWQENPFGYRVVDLILHLSIGILIFFLTLKLLNLLKEKSFLKENAYLISIITSGLFLLHPVQTQTATYITQMRLEGTVTLFSFLVLITFAYAVLTKNIYIKTFLYLLSFTFTSFAAGTKEIIVVLPFLVLLIDWFFIAQGDFKKILSRILIHTIFFVTLFGTLSNFGIKTTRIIKEAPKTELANHRGNTITEKITDKITMQPYFISQFKVILHYITMFFWPFGITFDYGFVLSRSFWAPDAVYPFIALMLILISGLFLFIQNRSNFVSFSIAWFFACVLPRASIVPSTELVCDYKTYLASFGILFFIAVLATGIIKFVPQKIKIQEFALTALIIIAVGVATQKQNLIWSSELAFWKDATKKTPGKARLYNNYAVALADLGQTDRAIKVYKKACRLDPNYAEPVINLAFQYQAKGEQTIALQYYGKALNMQEMHPEMYLNLGVLHYHAKNYAPATSCFKTAIQLKPYYSLAHYNLSRIYIEQNNLELASNHLEQAYRGDLKDIEFYYLHGSINYQLQRLDKAIPSLEVVAKNRPNYKNTISLLANCNYQKHDYKKASNYFGLIYSQNKSNLNAYNFGQTLLNSGNPEQAITLFEQCESDLNNFPYAALHKANCLTQVGKKDEAKKYLLNVMPKISAEQIKQESLEFANTIS